MTLVEKIKQDQLNARKEGDTAKASNLTFLLGQLSQKKAPTDQDAIDLIRATVKSTKAAYKDELPASVSYDIKIMEAYLPMELSDDKIIDFLDKARDAQKWDDRELGASEDHVEVASMADMSAFNDALSLTSHLNKITEESCKRFKIDS